MTADIRVGGYGRRHGRGTPTYEGPIGSDWQRNSRGRFFQVHRNQNLVDVEYFSEHGPRIIIYRVRVSDIKLIDNTLNLVPPEHLEWFIDHKREGILLSEGAGRGCSESLTGGLNPSYDDPTTTYFDESRGIIITYGAVWRNRHLGIVPTIFHEIGHTLTARSRISYHHMSRGIASELNATRVSRNSGGLEALCNAYMYMICYGSFEQGIRAYGTGTGSQKNRLTREGLRGCPAFTSMLSDEWRTRFAER